MTTRIDPYEGLTDDEFDSYVDQLLARKPASVTVSVRMPVTLLDRLKSAAAAHGTPYQTYMKALLEAALNGPESRRKPTTPPRAPRRSGVRRRGK